MALVSRSVFRTLGELSGAITILLVTLLFFSLTTSNFLSAQNVAVIARQGAILAVVGFGSTLVIMHRGIDLSIGSVVGVSCYLMALGVKGLGSYSLAALLAVLGGGFCGLVSGLLVARCHLPPFIATFGMLGIGRGLVWVMTEGRPFGEFAPWFHQVFYVRASVLGVPNPVWITLGVFLVMHLITRHTPYGNGLYAVGGSEEAARLSGLPVTSYKASVYVWSGLLAGLAGVLLAAKLNVVDPNAGSFYEFDAVAISVIGGASFHGGRGTMVGTLLGAANIAMLRGGLTLTEVAPWWQEIAVGVFLVMVFLLEKIRFAERALAWAEVPR